MRFWGSLLGVLGLGLVSPAWGEILPVEDPFGRIQPLGFMARLIPFVSVPAEQGVAPTARPQYVTPLHDSGGRLFINDLRGVLYVTNQSGAAAAPYIDLRTQNINAFAGASPAVNGFNGVAFHPNFDGDPGKPGYGVFYTSTILRDATAAPSIGTADGASSIQITEFTTGDPGTNSFAGTSRVVATIGGSGNNGTISFNTTAAPGSVDYGLLYIASGEGHDNDAAQQAQDLGSAQGKILRINPAVGPNGEAFTVPADNPYVGRSGALAEVWASGLRNPQSFGWDSGTGTMYINDIGQAGIEEVNVGRAGADYGWSKREGIFATVYAYGYNPDNESIYPWPEGADHSGYTDPVACYSHNEGYAVGSGMVYRGSGIPQLTGKYILADIVLGRLFAFDPAGASGGCGATLSELLLTLNGETVNLSQDLGYSTFVNGPRVDARLSLDNDGELLLALKANGEVYRLEAEVVPEPGSLALLGLGVALCLRRGRMGGRGVAAHG